jgi:hypothetical protein
MLASIMAPLSSIKINVLKFPLNKISERILGLNEPFALTLVFPHCKQDPIYVFQEIKLRGLVPNSYIHVSVSDFDLYFCMI